MFKEETNVLRGSTPLPHSHEINSDKAISLNTKKSDFF